LVFIFYIYIVILIPPDGIKPLPVKGKEFPEFLIQVLGIPEHNDMIPDFGDQFKFLLWSNINLVDLGFQERIPVNVK
jgi:hypothetical protein